MNMQKKQIKINPDFFSLGRKKKRKSKTNKPQFKHSLKTKDIKKKLLNKIKQHQQREKEKNSITTKQSEEKPLTIEQEFQQSFEYLNNLKNKKKKKNTTEIKIETPIQINSKSNAQTQKNNSLLRPDPPYGVLKTGKKPLYRDYMKRKYNQTPSIVIHNTPKDVKTVPEAHIIERQQKLKNLKKKYKVRKRRFTLGKNLKNGKIGVLIKNRTMKKKVQKVLEELKNEPLFDIKNYLRKHGLLRIGTPAPEKIIRNIYQDSKSAGQIYNRSSDVLLHNYLNEVV